MGPKLGSKSLLYMYQFFSMMLVNVAVTSSPTFTSFLSRVTLQTGSLLNDVGACCAKTKLFNPNNNKILIQLSDDFFIIMQYIAVSNTNPQIYKLLPKHLTNSKILTNAFIHIHLWEIGLNRFKVIPPREVNFVT